MNEGLETNVRQSAPEPLLLKVEQAAGLIGVGRSQMYKLIADGSLPSVAIGRARRVPLAALRAWVDRQVAGEAA